MSTSTSELIGASVRRIDALEKVLGMTRYGQDFWMDGMLYGGVLRRIFPGKNAMVALRY